MNQNHPKQPLLQTKNECHSLLSAYSISAMRLRKLGEHHVAYPEQIGSLAQICAYLINNYSEKPQELITVMERSLADELQKELEIINAEISALFERRKRSPLNTPYGENEIVNLTLKINDLERRKALSAAEIIQIIICDTFNRISSDHGTELLGGFNPETYEYHNAADCAASTEHSANQNMNKL